MRFNGTVTINAPRERVWKFLTDPRELMQCAPGLESLDVVAPNGPSSMRRITRR